jgi:hypothetical protein
MGAIPRVTFSAVGGWVMAYYFFFRLLSRGTTVWVTCFFLLPSSSTYAHFFYFIF